MAEPILQALSIRQTSRRTLYLAVPVLLGLLAASALIGGRATQSDLGGALCSDMARLLSEPKWHCLEQRNTTSQFSMLRDVLSLFMVVVVAITPALIYRQWLGIRELLPKMDELKQLSVSVEAEERFKEEVDAANRYFGRVGRWGVVIAFCATAAMLMIALGQYSGIYWVFAPGGLSTVEQATWTSDAYSSWWVGIESAPVAWLIYVIAGSLAIYFILIMNLVGSRAVLLLWRTRSYVTFDANEDNPDGYFGWRQPREVLVPTYVASAIHGLALAVVVLTIAPDSWWLAAPVLLQWILVVPFYLAIPLLTTHRSIAAYKIRKEAELLKRLGGLPTSDASLEEEGQREIVAQRLERVRKVHTLPFRRPRDWLVAVFTLLAGIASIYSVVVLLYGGP